MISWWALDDSRYFLVGSEWSLQKIKLQIASPSGCRTDSTLVFRRRENFATFRNGEIFPAKFSRPENFPCPVFQFCFFYSLSLTLDRQYFNADGWVCYWAPRSGSQGKRVLVAFGSRHTHPEPYSETAKWFPTNAAIAFHSFTITISSLALLTENPCTAPASVKMAEI